jgi:hypothetical protein
MTMLEYRRPGPPPGAQWATDRAYSIFRQREACTDPDLPYGRALPLARSAYGTVTLRAGTSAGAAKLELTVATADDDVDMLDEVHEAWHGPEQLPDEFFRFGVAFADGRATSNLPGAYWNAPQDGPVIVGYSFGPRGRAGEIPGFVLDWTVWPTPPPGPITIACAWPAGGLAESQLTLDARDLIPAE